MKVRLWSRFKVNVTNAKFIGQVHKVKNAGLFTSTYYWKEVIKEKVEHGNTTVL